MDGGGLVSTDTLGLKEQKQESSGLWTKCGLGRAECQLHLSALTPCRHLGATGTSRRSGEGPRSYLHRLGVGAVSRRSAHSVL